MLVGHATSRRFSPRHYCKAEQKLILNLFLIVIGQAVLTAIAAYLVARFIDGLRIWLPILSLLGGMALILGLALWIVPEALNRINSTSFSYLFLIGAGIYGFLTLFLGLVHKGIHRFSDLIGLQIGDAACNFADGLIIGSAAVVDPSLGLFVACTMTLHEIPMEIVDVNLIMAQGLSVERAGLINGLISVTVALIACVVVMLMGAGATIPVANIVAIGTGILAMIALSLILKSGNQILKSSYVQNLGT